MLQVLIPTNPEFQKYEAQLKELYEKNQEKICDTNDFEFIRDNTWFYMFVLNNRLAGAIYYFMDGCNLFLNGFSVRKIFKVNLLALRLSTTWFRKPIYAEAQNRASALCLLKCGFKRKEGNLFCLEDS